ncbi:MAG: PP2C family serine/threonine-protein phosphatase [Anaerolineaceae bacterium]
MIWKSTGVSVIGTSHVKIGKPCQDSHAIQSLNNGCLIGVVADGLGSAEKSEIGSKLAVQTAMAVLGAGLIVCIPESDEAWQALLSKAFFEARAALEAEAANLKLELRDLGTTLICFIAANGNIAIGQIGDGAVVVQFTNGTLATVSSPQRGEFANETVPLTMDNALQRVCYHVQPAQIKNIAAFSDGLQNLALVTATYEPFAPFFTPLFDYLAATADTAVMPAKLQDFLSSERICGRTDDDKTLLLACPVDALPEEKPL